MTRNNFTQNGRTNDETMDGMAPHDQNSTFVYSPSGTHMFDPLCDLHEQGQACYLSSSDHRHPSNSQSFEGEPSQAILSPLNEVSSLNYFFFVL